MSLREYRVPAIFYDDHRSRDLPESGVSELVRHAGARAVVRMDDDAFRDLYGDAIHYSDRMIAEEMGLPSLTASARATVKSLRKQNPELTEEADRVRREENRKFMNAIYDPDRFKQASKEETS